MTSLPITWEHEGIMLPNQITEDVLQYLKNFEIRDDDILLCTYPKSGTHWLIQIINLLRVDGDYDKLMELGLCAKRSPPIEMCIPNDDGSVKYCYKDYEQLPSPRLLVTHLPFQFLPKQVFEKKTKIIYVARNPKDTAVSMYYFSKPLMKKNNINLEWNQFVQMFMSDKAIFGPWASHVIPFWNYRNEDNVLFLKYEDIKKDPIANIQKVAELVGASTSESILKKTAENSSPERTKKAMVHDKNSDIQKIEVGAFVRKGIIGDWMTHFSVADSRKFDEIIKQQLNDCGLEMAFE